MKKDKNKTLSVNAKRELEVLSHYYHIDYDKQSIDIASHFKSVNEIIVPYIGNKKHPVLVNSFLTTLSDISHTIPYPYKMNLSMSIDNYNDYKPIDLMNSIQDSLEIFNYDVKKERNINHIKMSLLIAAGVIIFAWLFYICSFKLFGEDETLHNTIHEIVYTIACVLLWEGVYLLFLPSQQYNSVSHFLLKQIRSISLCDKKGKVLAKRDINELKEDWVHEGKWQKRCRRIFLISATGYLCLALCGIPNIIALFLAIKEGAFTLILAIISLMVSLILCLTSFSTLSYYNGSGPFKRYVLPLNITSLGFVSIVLALHITNAVLYKQTSIFWLVSSSLLLIISALGIFGAIILSKKRNKK